MSTENQTIANRVERSVIQSTTDYDMFKIYDTNREVHGRAEALGELMKETGGNLQPVLISTDGYTIDGQHRVKGCKIFNLPIYYIRLDVTYDEAQVIMRNINTEQKSWTDYDFMRMNAQLGIPGYEFYMNLMTKKSDMSLIKALGKLERKQIRAQEPAMIVPRAVEKLELVRYLSEAHKSAIGETPRMREFMRALNIIEDRMQELRDQGVRIPTRTPYKKIKKNFMRVVGDFGVLDRPNIIARKMSEAIDYRSKKTETRLGLIK